MKQYIFFSWGIRCGIVVFWTFVLALLLLVPRLHFFERNSITVFTWSGVFSQAMIDEFEQETGIKVYIKYYVSNEELLVKLRATQGAGYDLVIPSDYAVKKLIYEKVLKKLDKQKINFLPSLNPLLMGHFFDPQNEYAIPFEWEIYVIGFTEAFKSLQKNMPEHLWDLIFKPSHFGSGYRIVMVNDAVEAISMATRYLYGSMTSLNETQQNAVQNLLISQRPWIEAYSSVRSDYYLGTNNVMVAMAQNAEIWRAVRDYKNIEYIVPRDTFITIEHCAIPAGSTKDDLVYLFLNFIYSKKSMQHHYDVFQYCPARIDIVNSLPATQRQKDIIVSSKKAFKHYYFMQDVLSEQKKHDVWISVKA